MLRFIIKQNDSVFMESNYEKRIKEKFKID